MSLDELRRRKHDLDQATTAYRQAVAQAHAEGHSLREIARIVGVSHQTISDLIKKAGA